MSIESVPNRDYPPAVLLRVSYREDGKLRKRTLANRSCLSSEVIEVLKVLLRGGVAVPSAESAFMVERSLPHGHVAAVLGTARGSGSAMGFSSVPQELQPVLQAMLVARSLVLYDLASTWLTGRCCCLAARGHSRDGKRHDPQIVFGL